MLYGWRTVTRLQIPRSQSSIATTSSSITITRGLQRGPARPLLQRKLVVRRAPTDVLFCNVKTASASQPFHVTPVAAAAPVLDCLDDAGSIDSRASCCSLLLRARRR